MILLLIIVMITRIVKIILIKIIMKIIIIMKARRTILLIRILRNLSLATSSPHRQPVVDSIILRFAALHPS